METADLATGVALKATIDKIVAVQATNALTGSKARVIVTDADGKQLVSPAGLIEAIGESAYNTICATALTSLNTSLASTKTTKETALDAL